METNRKIFTENDLKKIDQLLRYYFNNNINKCNEYSDIASIISSKFYNYKKLDAFEDISDFLTLIMNVTDDLLRKNESNSSSFEKLDEEDKKCLNHIMENLKSIKSSDVPLGYLDFFILFSNIKILLSVNETEVLIKDIDSLSSFLSVLRDFASKSNKYYFRGQENSEWEPIASIFRSDYKGKEKQFYDDVLKHCPEEFDGLGHLDRLVKMQHYGLPTRLLDITSNPLIALYFACQVFSSKENDTDGAVFVFQPQEVKNAESDVGMMIATLACFSEEDQAEIALSPFTKNKEDLYENKTVERFFYEISKERSSFKRIINTDDLHKNCFIQPKYTNERVKCQAGAFIMIGIDKDSLVKSKTKKDLATKYKIIIPKENKKDLLMELDNLAINRATVYQNLENVTRYIREKEI